MSVDVVLFDADGVVQAAKPERFNVWRAILGPDRDLDPFFAHLSKAERAALDGRSNFVDALSRTLSEWQCRGTVDDALAAWTMIAVDAGVVELVRTLRRHAVGCHLASNQESYRASYMSEKLGYASLFHREFYSCHLGVAKPDGEFFRKILRELGVPPRRVLFLDDDGPNVDSARAAGLQATLFTRNGGPEALKHALNEAGVSVV